MLIKLMAKVDFADSILRGSYTYQLTTPTLKEQCFLKAEAIYNSCKHKYSKTK